MKKWDPKAADVQKIIFVRYLSADESIFIKILLNLNLFKYK